MAAPRYATLVTGIKRLVAAITSSSGESDAEKIVATNLAGVLDPSLLNAAETGASRVVMTRDDGTLDPSILPPGMGSDTASIVASEALAAGDFVNIWDDAGVPKVRKADATTEGKEANGFVLSAVTASAAATVHFEGRNTQLTGMTGGARQYLSTTPGGRTTVAPSGVGNVVQYLGTAYSGTAMVFEPADTITLA